MRESALEEKLRKAVEAAGGRCIKLNPLWYRGIPDRLILLPGARVFFVELKAKGGRASRFQKAWRTFLRGLGFQSLILYDLKEIKEFIENEL